MKFLIIWIKQNKLESLILLIILAVSIFVRFYRLSDYMIFLGDEGRDALIIKDILVSHIIPSIGPPSSVGTIYLGPLYYYMMAASMAIFWLNPVAAAGMVALIGVLAVVLIYYLSRVWFGMWSAVLAASVYSLSFVTINYSRFSWNPNPAPFFALLAIFGLDRARRTKNFLWFILTGMSLAAAVQMHYLSLILLPVFGLLWILEIRQNPQKYKNFFLGTILAIGSFIFLMLPLILFDFRHNFLNYRGLIALLTKSDSNVGFNLFESFGKILPIYNDKLTGRYLGAENFLATPIVTILVLIPLMFVLYKFFSKKEKINWPLLVLGIWLLVGLIGISLFKLEVFDHYLGYLSPVPFLLLGGIIYLLNDKWKKIVTISIIIVLGFLNLQKNPLLQSPNNQLGKTQEITKLIIKEAGNEPFNFALISKNNYDSAYQFYFYVYGHEPKVVPIEITDQLLVVCEDPVCEPVGNAKYEIAGFGWTLINKESEFKGVKIFRLIHNPAQPK